MSMPNYLARIKSAGVYRYVFDKTEIPETDRQSLRLVVGYSERGPFNTPVFIKDAAEFITTFGNISRRMERKGIFFHRMAIQALEAGPILALNLKPFKNETSKMISFNASDITCDTKMDVNIAADSIQLTAYDDKGVAAKDDKSQPIVRDFQSPVPDYKLDTAANCFVYVGSKSKDATHIRTIEGGKQYYWTGGQVIPADPTAGKTASFQYDKVYINGEYITATGNKVSIPGLQTDLKDKLIDDALVALDGTNVAGEKLTTIYDTNRFWKVADDLMGISPVSGNVASKADYMRIVQTGSKEDSVTLFMRPVVPDGWNVKISDWFAQEATTEMPSYMEALRDHYLSEFFMEIYAFRGDFRSEELFSEKGTLGSYVRGKFQPFCKYDKADKTLRTNADYADAFGRPADALDAMSDAQTSNFIGKYQGIMFPAFTDANGTFISIDSVFNADTAAHKCLMALNEQLLDDAYEFDFNYDGLYKPTDGEAAPTIPPLHENESAKEVGISHLVHRLTSAVHQHTAGVTDKDDYASYDSVKVMPINASIVGYYLEGYNYATIHRTESGRSLVEDKIMPVLGYKGIREALTNNVDVEYKYWVDTFQGYPGVSMKSEITALVKQKFNALAILNFPPMSDCATYMGYPGLVGGFDMKEVTKRGSGISLPVEVQGASWAAFYTQLRMTDGTNKFIIPSAALVSNLFMQKWSVRQPYYIVAGPNHGRIDYPGVVGPDYNYARADLDQLEPFGVNAIIYIPRKGTVINSNQTAKQTPVTALSKVHIRELVTYLQDTIEHMLRGYQWELNTSSLRDAVRSKCEVYCDHIKANGGIYAYRIVCDETNNTQEVIDNEMLIVDVEIEPAYGAGKMVQTLTIHRTGGIAASPRN